MPTSGCARQPTHSTSRHRCTGEEVPVVVLAVDESLLDVDPDPDVDPVEERDDEVDPEAGDVDADDDVEVEGDGELAVFEVVTVFWMPDRPLVSLAVTCVTGVDADSPALP
jgi:hypothetical protein